MTVKELGEQVRFDNCVTIVSGYNGKVLSHIYKVGKREVVDNETTSPQEEMVQDLISIIHCFSCRIYGLRKYKNKISEDKDV